MSIATHEELKSELLGLAEEAVEATLQWDTAHPERTFAEIETFVLDLRRRIGQRLAVALCEHQGAAQPPPSITCPECGRAIHYKDTEPRRVGSLVGEVVFERRYYYCEHCGSGVFPPG
jgi:uncharacterized OB-fold protein